MNIRNSEIISIINISSSVVLCLAPGPGHAIPRNIFIIDRDANINNIITLITAHKSVALWDRIL